MNTMMTDLEALHMTAESLATVIEAAERIAADSDPALARLLAHARALADELTNDLDVHVEQIGAAA